MTLPFLVYSYMVQFHELRISPNDRNLIVDVAIPPESFYENTYIEAIQICTQDQYKFSNTPPSELIFDSTKYTGDEEYPNWNIPSLHIYGDKEHVRMCLSEILLDKTDLTNNIIFVYVKIGGSYAIDTPCGFDVQYNLGVTLNWKRIYDIGLSYMKDVTSNNCTVSSDFIDFILNFNALKLSLLACNYINVIDIWNRFTKYLPSSVHKHSGCGCR